MARNQQRGFTLVETSTVLAIIAVVVSMAVSGFGRLVQRSAVDGMAAELAADLQFARSEAVARNQVVRVTFASNDVGGRCYVIHTGADDACACNSKGNAQCTEGATAIKQVNLRADRGSTVTTKIHTMKYDPLHGTVTPTATIKIESDAGQAIHHVVNMLGRVRTCTPNATPGYKSC